MGTPGSCRKQFWLWGHLSWGHQIGSKQSQVAFRKPPFGRGKSTEVRRFAADAGIAMRVGMFKPSSHRWPRF